MKRAAENQLTKDDGDEDDDDIQEIEQPGQGFQKAGESALAKRQIRALPKRALGGAAAKAASFNGFSSTPPPSSESDKESTPKFGGFAGFGAGSAMASNPFTFSAPTVSVFPSPNPDSGSKLLSNPKPGQTTTFTSFGSDGTSPPKSNGHSENDSTALKYYKSLRGLNVSFLSAVSKAIEEDPFVDALGLLESYKKLRMTVQSEFDNASKITSTSSFSSGFSSPLGSVTADGDKGPQAPQFAMPKPPTSFSGFLTTTSTKLSSTNDGPISFSAPSTTKPGGFTFSAVTSSSSVPSPFNLPAKGMESLDSSAASASELPKSAFSFGGSKSDDTSMPTPSAFSFSPSTSTKPTSETSTNVVESSTATTVPSLLTTPGSSAFGFSSSIPNFFTTSNTVNASSEDGIKTLKAYKFGSGDAVTKTLLPTTTTGDSVQGSDKPDLPKEPAKSFGANLFGSSSMSSDPASGPLSEKPASMFGTSSPTKPSVFGFGKPGGSIGNPVGFGFGAPSIKAGEGSSAGSSKPPTGLGVVPKTMEGKLSPPPTERSEESTPQPEGNEEAPTTEDDTTKLLPTGNHDEEGEGEEEEETMHAVRCKVFKLTKKDDKNEWKDLGIGMFRLKKHKETDVRRVLMRNSSTGRILINFRLYSGFKPSLAKTSISFVGHDSGVPTSYRIRVKTEDQASELKAAIDREMAAFTATV
ncbi:hypothetical protein ID866_3513 [Astraeus odoratus]|nr:hypothetical protein ID866_3513 [Astraeus odoratus]